MKLLEEAVRELKGEEIEDDVRATVNLGVDLKIDETYVPEMNQRLMVYRKIAATRTEKDLDKVLEEIRDRYGPLPSSILNLAEYGRVRVIADRLGVDAIDREGKIVVIKFRPQTRVDPMRLVKVVHEYPGAILVPPSSLKLDLDAAVSGDGSRLARQAGDLKVSGYQLPGNYQSSENYQSRGSRRPSGLRGEAQSSWWTSRATAGTVTSGFTKEAVLKQPEKDPRAKGGLFERLEALLRALG